MAQGQKTTSIVTYGSVVLLGSIINESQCIALVLQGEFPQKEFSYAIN